MKKSPKVKLKPSGNGKPINPAGKVVRDALHGLIRIEPEDEVLLRLIDTPEFQRLRRVRQLGVSIFTYPGAEHSRFTHSLGVMNFAQRMLGILEHRYRGEKQVRGMLQENGRFVKIAALLHDVGHGPFSHLMERAFDGTDHHEDRTVRLITNESSAISQVLKRFKIPAQKVADIIEKTSACPLLSDIVSSQLDADRMDYILRDALSTGVKYGAFDWEWLLNCLCIGGEPGQRGKVKPNQWRLCLDEKRGLYSAEQLIIARMHMSFQVYFHRVTRGWEAHLLCLFRIAVDLAKTGKLPKDTPALVQRFLEREGKLSDAEFLWVDESTLIGAMQCWANASGGPHQKLARLAMAFLCREKCFESRELKNLNLERAAGFERQLSDHGQKGVDWLLDEIPFNSYSDFGAVFRDKRPADDAQVSTKAILLSSGGLTERAKPMETDSVILQAMGNKPPRPVPRIFFLKELTEHVEKSLA
ncbi:MAG TPA: HD domain-containing protein [Clostridia bacterium]|nr:HD domain-containing protein [Clostridia bacterium]